MSVGGTLTYQDVTNIDSVGVITARAGVHITGGNVAVGHNNPSVNLHVKGSASNGQIYLGGTGAHSQIYADNDGVLILNADQGNSAANSYLGFNVDNSERLRIDSSGHLKHTGLRSGNSQNKLAILSAPSYNTSEEDVIIYQVENEASSNQLSIGGGTSSRNAVTALSFRTASAVNTTGGTERLRITSAGVVKVGANTLVTPSTDADNFIIDTGDVDSGISILSATTGRIYFGDAADNDVGSIRYVHTDNSMRFETDTSERLRIDSSGRLNIGSSSAPGTVGGFSHINVHGTGINANGAIGLYRNSASPSAGQGIGAIYFANSDGNPGAYIQGQSDGTWGTNDYPGRLVFFTTSDGASSATERLRIASNGSLNSGNITISGSQNTHNPDNYSMFLSDNHANTFFGLNFRLGYSNGSGNHQLEVNNQHGTIGGAGILIGGNGSNYVNEIQFINAPANQTAGTRVDDSKRRLSIESSGRVVIHGNGTVRSSWPGAVCSVHNLAMMDAGSGFSWGLRANSGDTQWCLERIAGNNSFSDSNIKFRVYNNGNYMFAGSNSSDRDIKENIQDISGTSLNLIDQLRPRTFNFKESEGYSTEPKTGFVAQEIGAVIPSIVNGTDGQKDMGVDYNGLVAHLVKAVQELKAENDSLRSRLDTAGL